MKPIILALFVALAAVFALAGCGQKGPLYLPGHNPNPPKPLVKPAQDQGQNTSSDAAGQGSDNGSAPSGATDSDSHDKP